MMNKYDIETIFRREYRRLRETVDEDGVLPAYAEVRTGHASKKLGHCSMRPIYDEPCISSNGQGYKLDHFYFSTRILNTQALLETIRHEVAHALAIYHYGPMATGKNGHSHLWQHFAIMCGAEPKARVAGGMEPVRHNYFIVCNPCDQNVLALQKRSKRWDAVASGRHPYQCGRCKSSDLRAV